MPCDSDNEAVAAHKTNRTTGVVCHSGQFTDGPLSISAQVGERRRSFFNQAGAILTNYEGMLCFNKHTLFI